jgi:hypothetical protein
MLNDRISRMSQTVEKEVFKLLYKPTTLAITFVLIIFSL